MSAGRDAYDDVPYSALVFDDIDWSEVGDHNPGRRSERYGASEVDVPTEWADEAGRDERRWVRSAGSSSGLTVKVTGYSPSAGFVVTVVVAPKDHPPTWRWWGATARKANKTDESYYEHGGQ